MKELYHLYKLHFGIPPDKMEEIHLSVSTRRYFRIFRGTESVIGTYSPDVRETVAFCTFSDHFIQLGLNVPEVFAVSDDKQFYLQLDLGSERLHELVVNRTADSRSDPSVDTTTDPATEPATEPVTDPATDPTTDPVTDPTTEPVTDPTTDPATDPTTDPVTDPTTEPVTDPTTDPVTDPTTEPVTDPTTDPTTDPATEPVTDPTTDPVKEPFTNPTKDPSADPFTDSSSGTLDDSLLDLYRLAIEQLVKMQFEGDEGLDYSVAVPRPAFDRQSVLWDLNHFKYYFLKTAAVPFDEQLLEEAFDDCASRISGLEPRGFMFRDFQSRNMMVKDEAVYLIDFQGGRKGPVHYDLASMVFDSKLNLTGADRAQLVSYYLETAEKYGVIDRATFMTDFHLVALVRILQALGAYGLRGNIEKKAVFLQSIPAGLNNLAFVLENLEPGTISDYFRGILLELAATGDTYRELPEAHEGLTVTIHSFSYRRPLPDDLSGNGGGFVYDCRFVTNPGRCDELRMLNGFDREVIQFLEADPEVGTFLRSIQQQLEQVVHSYVERDYRNLMVSFGCTGGRHRSVFFAHAIAEWCRTLEGLRVLEYHRELHLEA